MAFILSALGALGSGVANYFASQNAMKAQKRAAAETARAGQDYMRQADARYSPYAQGGRGAFDAYLGSLGLNGSQDAMAAYFNSPDYRLAQDAGRRELDAMSAARGS